jgi:predicted kinase
MAFRYRLKHKRPLGTLSANKNRIGQKGNQFMSFELPEDAPAEDSEATPKKRLIAMRGLPGSGKSTRVKALVREMDGAGYIVSKDSLRILYPEATEKHIHRLQTDELYRLSGAKVSPIIVDNTHMDPRSIQQLEGFCRFHGYEFQVEDVPTPWYECIMRDAHRKAEGERYVGRSVIIQMAQRYGVFEIPMPDRTPPPLCVRAGQKGLGRFHERTAPGRAEDDA